MNIMMVQTKWKLNIAELYIKLFYIQSKEIGSKKYYEETRTWKMAKWDFALILTLEKRRKTHGWAQ